MMSDEPNVAAAFMANLSSNSSQINKVSTFNDNIFETVSPSWPYEVPQDEHLDSNEDSIHEDNTIPYDQYLATKESQDVPTEAYPIPPTAAYMLQTMKFLSTIFFLLVVQETLFSAIADRKFIENTCKGTPNYDLCLSTILADPKSEKANLTGLALIAVAGVEHKGDETIKQIKDLKSSKPELRPALDYCTQVYHTIVKVDVPMANDALKLGNPKFGEDGMADSAVETQACERSFEEHGMTSPMTKQNKAVEAVANVARAIIHPKSEKADLTGLALIAVAGVEHKGDETIKQIKDLKSSKPELRPALDYCTQVYHTIVKVDVPMANDALKLGNPKFGEDGMADSAVETQACERSFEEHGMTSPMTKQNKAVEAVANVARAIIPRDAWEWVEKLFQDNKRTRTVALKGELRMLHMGEQSADEYFSKIDSLVTLLSGLGSDVSEDDVVTYAINGLSHNTEEMRLRSKSLIHPTNMTASAPQVLLATSNIRVRKFTTDNKCSIDFDPYGFTVQDYHARQTLLRCDSTGDLYPLHVAASDFALLTNNHSLWHQRLGHPYDITKYATEILEQAQMLNCNPCRTPTETEKKLGHEGSPVTDPTLYRNLVGSLQYLIFTRPDLAYAVQQLCLYMHDPREPHLNAMKCVLRYLRGTTDLGLQLFRSTTSQLIAYSDADWAGSETSWIRNLLRELHTPLFTTILVYYDNVSSVYMSAKPVQHQRTKHIEIDIYFVRDKVAVGHVRALHVPSRFHYAYIFTKGLPYPLFANFRSSLSVRKTPAPTAGAYYSTYYI
nr:pectinesterase inhibitor [Tanacetum cinerariifolium]